jgi:hypothetical protein
MISIGQCRSSQGPYDRERDEHGVCARSDSSTIEDILPEAKENLSDVAHLMHCLTSA